MMAEALLGMLQVLEPESDWDQLVRVCRHLRQVATPSRNKLSRMAAVTELFGLGLMLMETCDQGSCKTYRATRYRDGLLIALLISCPMRLKNLTELVIGKHLIFDGQDYRLNLTAAETKTGRPYVAAIPQVLTTHVHQWLHVYRTRLQSIAAVRLKTMWDRLWLDHLGRPMSSNAIRFQIERRTKEAFGTAIWPHLFRHCAVTELVDSAPEEIGIAPDLLGHADLETTRKHYIQAHGMTAHVRVQEMITARRRAAAARRTAGA